MAGPRGAGAGAGDGDAGSQGQGRGSPNTEIPGMAECLAGKPPLPPGL